MRNLKSVNQYSEIDDIRNDLDSLKNSVIELTQHIKRDGATQTQILKEKAKMQIEDLKETGQAQIEQVEKRVQEKPAESIAIAFAAGLAASFLLGRR